MGVSFGFLGRFCAGRGLCFDHGCFGFEFVGFGFDFGRGIEEETGCIGTYRCKTGRNWHVATFWRDQDLRGCRNSDRPAIVVFEGRRNQTYLSF